MSQNTSHAVMAQRYEAHDSLDDFPTMPWGTRALVEHIIRQKLQPHGTLGTCWEPACNRGYMARPLREYFAAVYASDICDYGWDRMNGIDDFLLPGTRPDFGNGQIADWVITNPPFRLAEQFIERAMNCTRIGFAMLVRTSFLESVGRYERLFSRNPPTIVCQFVERLPMIKGRMNRKASTATSYAWLVWKHGMSPHPFMWIPPCRTKLERDSDYPVLSEAAE